MMHDDERVREYLAGQVVLGRVGEPDDIAAAVAALLAEGNHWMTAQRVEVSGGQQI